MKGAEIEYKKIGSEPFGGKFDGDVQSHRALTFI